MVHRLQMQLVKSEKLLEKLLVRPEVDGVRTTRLGGSRTLNGRLDLAVKPAQIDGRILGTNEASLLKTALHKGEPQVVAGVVIAGIILGREVCEAEERGRAQQEATPGVGE